MALSEIAALMNGVADGPGIQWAASCDLVGKGLGKVLGGGVCWVGFGFGCELVRCGAGSGSGSSGCGAVRSVSLVGGRLFRVGDSHSRRRCEARR